MDRKQITLVEKKVLEKLIRSLKRMCNYNIEICKLSDNNDIVFSIEFKCYYTNNNEIEYIDDIKNVEDMIRECFDDCYVNIEFDVNSDIKFEIYNEITENDIEYFIESVKQFIRKAEFILYDLDKEYKRFVEKFENIFKEKIKNE